MIDHEFLTSLIFPGWRRKDIEAERARIKALAESVLGESQPGREFLEFVAPGFRRQRVKQAAERDRAAVARSILSGPPAELSPRDKAAVRSVLGLPAQAGGKSRVKAANVQEVARRLLELKVWRDEHPGEPIDPEVAQEVESYYRDLSIDELAEVARILVGAGVEPSRELVKARRRTKDRRNSPRPLVG